MNESYTHTQARPLWGSAIAHRHCEAHTFFVRVLHVILLLPVRTDTPTNTVPGCIPVTSTLRHP